MTAPSDSRYNPDTTVYEMVVDNDTLNGLCEQWQHCEFLAMDTEFIRTTTFYPHVGLIQINDGGETSYLVDPLPITDWDKFRALMLNPAVTKVFHSCSEDIQVFMAAMNLVPTPIFDTQIAAALLNQGFGISYQNLVNLCLNVDLPKGETRSDWLQRPLTETQCQYAALDVACLPEIVRTQRQTLTQQNRLSWLEEECETLLQQYRGELLEDFSNFYLNIKGAWQLSRKELSILKELGKWRELRARKRDKPRNWIVRDRSLLDIARMAPQRVEQMSEMEGLGKQFLHYEGPEIIELVEAAANLPKDELPALLPRPLDARDKSRLKKGQQFVERVSEELALPVEMLARKRWLISILQEQSDQDASEKVNLPAELEGWRKPLLLPGLLEAMK